MLEERCLVSLLLLGLCAGNIVFREDTTPSRSLSLPRRTAPTTQAPPTFSNSELQCFIQDKVLHSDGQCYQLRTKGPCVEGQWLVLDKDKKDGRGRRRLACKSRPCDRPLRVYWPEDGQCHKLTEKTTLCPHEGNDLRTDSFGDGECACAKTFARFEPDILRGRNTTAEWEGVCYPLYHPGPCPAPKLLVPALLEGFGVVGRCAADPCVTENRRGRSAQFAVRASDGLCYMLGAKGACVDQEKFNVHPATNQPTCFSTLNTLSLYGDSAKRCDGNVNMLTNECRDEITVVMKSSPFVTDANRPDRNRVRRQG